MERLARQRKNLKCVDVEHAHLNGKVKGKCGNLKRWMYGMRPAASAWEQDNFKTLGEFGMAKGVSTPTMFHSVERGIQCVVHGDDFAFLGWQTLGEAVVFLKSHYELKLRGTRGSASAKGVASRSGADRIRHIERRVLWVQEAFKSGRVSLEEEFGKGNPPTF